MTLSEMSEAVAVQGGFVLPLSSADSNINFDQSGFMVGKLCLPLSLTTHPKIIQVLNGDRSSTSMRKCCTISLALSKAYKGDVTGACSTAEKVCVLPPLVRLAWSEPIPLPALTRTGSSWWSIVPQQLSRIQPCVPQNLHSADARFGRLRDFCRRLVSIMPSPPVERARGRLGVLTHISAHMAARRYRAFSWL